ncbi:uncharacterized protein K444DRAFT_527101 [Hyaloscypha bicolor E]|uniref:F-box domain-containing protein n=1 Tax=Hyaloscypha bicolor E TaxID=1095630 RepID=A0A2J6TEH9_9HELO|nr:uncharacterized protein K444DRAFT_527101 [Hyaloscypha bicolor E]PMD61399.1 hypothetical protein K444DRAFT_527101 [Hyaloscypha bicolor E]
MDSHEQKLSKPFRFLDLAPELRHKIYTILTSSPQPHIDLSSTYMSPHTHFPHALLLTCTQIYHELRPLYFTNNAFSLTILRRNETWSHLLTPPFLDNRRQIRSLRLLIVRWGTKDFFCRSLIPALEDCILNGRLRELEVVVRDQSVGGHYLGTQRNDIRKEYESWRKLKRVLRDPYLEKATLKEGQFAVVRNGWDAGSGNDVSYLLEKSGDEQDENLIQVI